MKIHYESTETWKKVTDYLRCSPDFYGHPRYDCVMIKTLGKPIFGRLLFIFTFAVEDRKYPLALIQPYDGHTGIRRQKDRDFGFYRVRRNTHLHSEIISVHSIIRGALLVDDFGKDGDFLIVDTIDGDMFLRLQQIYT